MKLLIFGSTGGTGRQLVGRALGRGHTVRAFLRDPGKLDAGHSRLEVFQGDVTDLGAVERAVEGQEAVLSALGVPGLPARRSTLRTDGTRNIVRAMEKAGVRRFISLSVLGAGDSWDILPLHYKYLLVPLLLRNAFVDHDGQEAVIRRSRLEWTIARPGNLTDSGYTGVYRHGFTAADKAIKLKISRADVADFMLEQLTDYTYLHETPGLSY